VPVESASGPFGKDGPSGPQILAEFLSETLIGPRADKVLVDGQKLSAVVKQGMGDAFAHLLNEGQKTKHGGDRAQAFEKVGALVGAIDAAAERAERADKLSKEDKAKADQLLVGILKDVFTHYVSLPLGTGPVVDSWLQVKPQDPQDFTQFTDQFVQKFDHLMTQYANKHGQQGQNDFNSFQNGLQSVQIEDQQNAKN
jgi:hypothetical protein